MSWRDALSQSGHDGLGFVVAAVFILSFLLLCFRKSEARTTFITASLFLICVAGLAVTIQATSLVTANRMIV